MHGYKPNYAISARQHSTGGPMPCTRKTWRGASRTHGTRHAHTRTHAHATPTLKGARLSAHKQMLARTNRLNIQHYTHNATNSSHTLCQQHPHTPPWSHAHDPGGKQRVVSSVNDAQRLPCPSPSSVLTHATPVLDTTGSTSRCIK